MIWAEICCLYLFGIVWTVLLLFVCTIFHAFRWWVRNYLEILKNKKLLNLSISFQVLASWNNYFWVDGISFQRLVLFVLDSGLPRYPLTNWKTLNIRCHPSEQESKTRRLAYYLLILCSFISFKNIIMIKGMIECNTRYLK